MIRSSVTKRFQTTVPVGVPEAVGVRRDDALAYKVRREEVVVGRHPEPEGCDPAPRGFLGLLKPAMAGCPNRLQRVPDALVLRGRELVQGIEVDLDAPLLARQVKIGV